MVSARSLGRLTPYADDDPWENYHPVRQRLRRRRQNQPLTFTRWRRIKRINLGGHHGES